MKLTPKAITATDIIIQTIASFQQELATVDSVCDILIDAMMKLKDTEDFTEDTLKRMNDAQARLSGLATAAKALEIIGPACDILAHEITG
jgi:hypothetical protein